MSIEYSIERLCFPIYLNNNTAESIYSLASHSMERGSLQASFSDPSFFPTEQSWVTYPCAPAHTATTQHHHPAPKQPNEQMRGAALLLVLLALLRCADSVSAFLSINTEALSSASSAAVKPYLRIREVQRGTTGNPREDGTDLQHIAVSLAHRTNPPSMTFSSTQ